MASLLLAHGAPAAIGADASTDAPKQNFPAIVVTEAVTGHLVDRIVATGTVRPVQEVFVQPLLEGLAVKSLKADVGDAVEANSVLATLNDDSLTLQRAEMEANKAKAQATIAQLQAQIIEARANAEEADRQRDRALTMAQKGTASTSQAEQATAAATAANARVRAAEHLLNVAEAELKVVGAQIADLNLKLARTDIRTPFAGIVAVRNAKVGAIATGVGEPLFTVIRDGALELVADVPEGDILKIKAGQKATIALAGGSDALTGSVRLVSPTVDQTTRLGAVHIEIDDSERARSGMYGSATIVVKETDGLALPLTAITVTRDGATARKVEDGVVKLVKVETGIQDGTSIQILSGLNPGDEVVAKAGAYVRDGDRITPVRQPEDLSN
ncbi:efflux RND transporter periplasmic adaptor subunit [Rhizobiaceae bacterium n13]|uniref:Efflux RND transporter periplasmic adaptor subunit n=2 Tax=Ferirhizobium litorale TaxID=2927786 RepID=A0AAE3QBB1_9HYPH|nr:efflux RND transporter periplasmic adaptor subunit [Fererhizobium litorale]MDI7860680.1 efflux RND transporter periplasmic adaptor subunit [Fererhizobium litorale]MDI7920828.1 efflux RND transporter periplasmic adaptor subunit [Fererhizobium litorale]